MKIIFLILSLYTSIALAEQVDPIHYSIREDDIIIGDLNAPNTIIEYSSLSCPLCGYFHVNIFPKIEDKYLSTKKVKFIFRNFPMKPADLKAGAIALCVPYEKRALFLKILFKTQRNWSTETSNHSEVLEHIARLGGLDDSVVKKCLEDRALEERLIQEREYAQNNIKINSTPTFIINGKKFHGLIDMPIIDKELS
jgi:protein-disulfide isomerase